MATYREKSIRDAGKDLRHAGSYMELAMRNLDRSANALQHEANLDPALREQADQAKEVYQAARMLTNACNNINLDPLEQYEEPEPNYIGGAEGLVLSGAEG